MKYFASVKTEKGLNTLPHNPCKLLGFELLKLAAGEQFTGQTGDREVLAVILGGKANFEVDGQKFDKVGGRPNVFNGKPHSVYMPAGADYRIVAEGAVEIGLTSAPSDLKTVPYVIAPAQVTNGAWGAANFKRYFHQILTQAGQPALPARRLIVGETFTPSGNWSTYPPTNTKWTTCPVRLTTRKCITSGSAPPTALACATITPARAKRKILRCATAPS